MTIKVARKDKATGQPIGNIVFEDNETSFKLVLDHTAQPLTAQIIRPPNPKMMKEMNEFKLESYKVRKIGWQEPNGLLTARITWENEEGQDIAVWTQSWKAPVQIPLSREESARFLETTKPEAGNPNPTEPPITAQEQQKLREARKSKETLVEEIKNTATLKHEAILTTAKTILTKMKDGQEVKLLTRPFDPNNELWNKPVTVKVMKRWNNQRESNTKTIQQEILRLWANITDSMEEVGKRIERKIIKKTRGQTNGNYKMTTPGDKGEPRERILGGETTLEWYDWQKHKANKKYPY